MPEFVNLSLRVSTVVEIGVPRWLTPYAESLFAIPTHMTPRERLMVMQTALGLQPDFVAVEIGSYLGASTAFLAVAAVQRNGTVHAVDTWMNQAMGHEGERDTWAEFKRNTHQFEHFIVAHRGTSAEIHRRDGEIPCDLLFVDGDHSYEGASLDLRTWLPSLRPGGILMMHDFDSPSVVQAFGDVVGANCIAPPQTIDRLMVCRPQAASAIATKA